MSRQAYKGYSLQSKAYRQFLGDATLGRVINCQACVPLSPGQSALFQCNDQKIRTSRRSVGTHQGLAARVPRPCGRDSAGQPVVCRGDTVPLPRRHCLEGFARALWRLSRRASAPFALEQMGCLAARLRSPGAGCGQRIRFDRLDHRQSPPAQRGG